MKLSELLEGKELLEETTKHKEKAETKKEPVKPKETKDAGFSKPVTYAAITIFTVVSLFAFFATQNASSNAEKANTQLEQIKSSTGAIINALMNKREENRKEWSRLELEQEKLNTSTEQIDVKLEKYNISVIN